MSSVYGNVRGKHFVLRQMNLYQTKEPDANLSGRYGCGATRMVVSWPNHGLTYIWPGRVAPYGNGAAESL